MSELQNIWDELERSKANGNRQGKWGFTVYRTDFEDQRLWREYRTYLRNTIKSAVDPDKDKPAVDPTTNTTTPASEEEDKKAKARKRIRTRIRANFELVVVADPALDGCTTAQVRQYHRQRVAAYLEGDAGRSSAPRTHGIGNDDGKGDGTTRPAEDAAATVENEAGTPSHPAPAPPAKDPADEAHEDDEDHDGHGEKPPAEEEEEEAAAGTSKPKRPRPPREEKRVGHVWQDYFLHVDADVLKRYGRACRQAQRLGGWPSLSAQNAYAAPFVAVVGEAERSDYRPRRFGAWAGDGSVPELTMAWQYVEITSLPGLYDRLSRRPLGRAQLLAEAEAGRSGSTGQGGGIGGGSMGVGVCVPGMRTGVVVREPLYGRAFAAIGAEDYGAWYEGFCFPPAVNRM